MKAIEDKEISKYLVETVKSYLLGRNIRIDLKRNLKMTCGVPQGSKTIPEEYHV